MLALFRRNRGGSDPRDRQPSARTPRRLTLESLEGRALLSVGSVMAHVGPQAAQAVPFNGHTEYAQYANPAGTLPAGTFEYIGTGHATHLGPFTADVFVTPHEDTYSFTAVFTAANGDQVLLSGEAKFTSPTSTSATGNATITGGTGRFMNATGKLHFKDVFSDRTTLAQANQTFKGIIQV